jgi:hypothetical protein
MNVGFEKHPSYLTAGFVDVAIRELAGAPEFSQDPVEFLNEIFEHNLPIKP